MTWAPWAFGLAPHHHDAALIGAPALIAHAAAALVLALLARALEAWLARAIAAVAAVRRWLASRPAPARGGARPPGAARRRAAARPPRRRPLPRASPAPDGLTLARPTGGRDHRRREYS